MEGESSAARHLADEKAFVSLDGQLSNRHLPKEVAGLRRYLAAGPET